MLLDGYGRPSRIAIYNGQTSNGWYQQDTCYDADGRVHFQSYRYQGTGFYQTNPVCSGAGDTYSYDALGRVTKIAHSDGTVITYSYNGHAAQVTDENGVSRINQIDSLGRLTTVCEISSNASMPGSGSPVNCGTDIPGIGFLTTYAYNVTAHSVTVTQGSQARTFQSDWVGRLTSITEPESSAPTSYSYSYSATAGLGLTVTRKRPKSQSGEHKRIDDHYHSI